MHFKVLGLMAVLLLVAGCEADTADNGTSGGGGTDTAAVPPPPPPPAPAPMPAFAYLRGGNENALIDFYKINKYHVSMLPYFLEKLQNIQEGDANLLDKTMLIYGSPMGDSNLHNHKRCPLFVAGGANGQLAGNMHLKAPPETPMANVMLGLMHKLGHDDLESFGDSTGDFSFTA